jgi:uncharacterized Zn finger protein
MSAAWGRFRPYVSVDERQRLAKAEIAKMTRKGQKLSPIILEGRTIVRTFWGKAWCDNLESYSDYENRLPRGRSYIRNGSVLDLQITTGRITAMVQGSSLYRQTIQISSLGKANWNRIKTDCSGRIDSLVELLQGRLSESVMRLITQKENGLFPKPSEIKLECSCPDWADMCKHVSAVLYGVGARLDEKPDLLFTLRGVDHVELLDHAGKADDLAGKTIAKASHTIQEKDLEQIFDIELADSTPLPSVAIPESKEKTQKIKTKLTPSVAKSKLKKLGKNARTKKPKKMKATKLSESARVKIIRAQRRRIALRKSRTGPQQ